MTFGELVNRSQTRACEILKERLNAREANGQKVYPEPALRNQAGEIVCAPDGLELPLRYDLAYLDESGEVQTENADSFAVNFREPVLANWENSLKIEIHSVCWDNMQFRLLPADHKYD